MDPDYSKLIESLRGSGRLVTRTLPTGDVVELIEKAVSEEIKVNDNGTITIVASDATVDRMGDVIEPKGWDLKNFRRNPVILINHSNNVESIVGHSINSRVTDGKLLLDVKLDGSDNAELVQSKIKAKSLRTVSVGFIPKKFEKILNEDDEWVPPFGFRFLKQELLETSFVAVPANPSAVIQASNEPIRLTDDEAQLRAVVNEFRKSAISASLKEGS